MTSLGDQRTMRPRRQGGAFLPRRRAPLPTLGIVVVLAGAEILLLALGLAWPRAVPLPAVVMSLMMVCLGLVVHAWQERRVGFVLAAALCGNLVATLLAHGLTLHAPWEKRWVALLQANAIAFGAAALVGLAARRRLYGAFGTGTLLRRFIGLGLLANSILAASAVGELLRRPGALPEYVAAIGSVTGWLALGLTALAGLWYEWAFVRGRLLNAVGPILLAAGVLAACTSVPWDQGRWLAYHILTAAWATFAAAILGYATHTGRHPAARLPAGPALAWVVGLGGLVLGLALRGAADDFLGPAPSAAALVFVSCLAADLAVGRRREGWAFAAGLPLLLAVALVVWFRRQPWDAETDGVVLAQAELLTAGLLTLLWLSGRRRLYGTAAPAPSAAPLLGLQVALLVVGHAALLGRALAALLARPDVGQPAAALSLAGTPLGWAAFVLMALAAPSYARKLLRMGWPVLACAAGLGLGALTACSIAAAGNGCLAIHTLLAVWTLTGFAVLGSTSAAGPVAVLAVLVLDLAIRAAMDDPLGPVLPAAAVLAVALQAVTLAVVRRSETWAFAAALCVNVMVSMLLGAFTEAGLRHWGWVRLIQANTIVTAAAALVWLAAGRRACSADRPASATPLLVTQVLLAVAGNLAMLVAAAVLLMWAPGAPSTVVTHVGGPAGWVALLLGGIAAAWYADRVRTPSTLDAWCAAGVGLGVLLACSVAAFTDNFWLAYHVLMGVWAGLGLAALTAGWRAGRQAAVPPAAVQGWVAVLDVLVAVLALRVLAYDPLGPWAPAAGLLVGALLAGVLALWTGRQSFVWWSGLLLVGVVVAFGVAADVHLPSDWVALLLLGQALAAAVCSAVGTVVRLRRPGRLPGGDALSFSHVAALLSLLGVMLLGALGGAGALMNLSVPPPGPLGWAALGSVVLALLVALWDPDALFPPAGLYAAAFAALGFTLSTLPATLPGPDVPALAAFVTLAAVFWRTARFWRRVGKWLGIPRRLGGWPRAWFGPAQALLGSAAVFLSVWLCRWHAGTAERFAGPVAVGLLLPAALLAAGPSRPRAQDVVLILVALLAVEQAWVGLEPMAAEQGLPRVGPVLAGAAAVSIAYAVGLPRLFRRASGWPLSGRRVGALVAALAVGGGLWAVLR
jgi:hypothetical protein